MEDQDRGAFLWYTLITPDADRAKSFYDAVVGWDIAPASSAPDPAIDYRMIARSDGGYAGGVLNSPKENPHKAIAPAWVGYVHVADVDDAVSRFEKAGGKCLAEPRDLEGVGRMALVADAQGAPLYVMNPVPPADNPEGKSDVFSTSAAQHFRWNELATTDQAAAIAFYGDIFGWRQEGEMDLGSMGKYKFLYHGQTRIGAIMNKPPAMPQSNWTYYIGVDDIDRAVSAVKTGGGQVAHGPSEIPGGEFTAVCIDPQDASFGLVGSRQ